MSKSTFSKCLSTWRQAAGMKQAELAERAAVSPSYISTLERGATHSLTGGALRPSEDVVKRLSRALGVPEDEMRIAAGYIPRRFEEMRAALNDPERAYQEMTAEQSAALRALLSRGRNMTVVPDRQLWETILAELRQQGADIAEIRRRVEGCGDG